MGIDYNANRKWNAKNYYQVSVRVPKSFQSLIVAAAKSSGESVNSYISNAIIARLGMDSLAEKPHSVHRFDPTPASACVVCGNPLPEGKARYCSDECKKKARAAQAREARRKRLSQSQPSED